jgi:UPF0755 protein
MQERTVERLERPYNWRRVERPPRKRSRARLAIIVVAVILAAIALLILYGAYEIHTPQGSSSTPFPFVVRPGDTESSVADRLHARGVLSNTLLFRIDARLQGMAGNLRTGTYTLRPNMSIDQMIKTLATYNVKLLTITIPPGWRAEEIASLLTAYGLNGRAFMHTVRHPNFPAGLPVGLPSGHSLEGFLFPDTYSVDPATSGRDFARIMVNQFNMEFGPHLRAVARRERRSIYRIVTMASIIEREDRFPLQKRLIASVYYNRLHDPGHFPYLQADPTVQYALGRPGHWWPIIRVTPRSVRSPYNTYAHPGLPPGPIANPDRGSILAAMHPAATRYYYFVAKRDTGILLFERTLIQHNIDAAKYG